ncbi:DUF3261 domain-containing protein [Vibrio ouci]|uniref:DUF3261 domain-containing protein n=1 Tax=Vibrio ouci TaxID=2499078 RepID=A0A4Y8WLI9_9VIBR|nr:DUF3261 domain-containing protein [Vibrio ouci]
MKLAHITKALTVLTMCGVLAACASKPKDTTPQVEIAQGQMVNLPSPSSLGYGLNASQLITATWTVDDNARSEQLPVQLQVSADKLVLAGFSSWGTRILSLTYQNDAINSDVLTGLGNALPAPEQVLFNLMITLWPSSAWEGPLNEVRWQVIDKEDSRAIFDSNGTQIIDIKYGNNEKLDGEILFHHLIDGYTIKVNTLQYQKEQLTPQ